MEKDSKREAEVLMAWGSDPEQVEKEVSTFIRIWYNSGLAQNSSDHENAKSVEQTAGSKALIWKQDIRIVPLCAGIYLLCYLDRSNIGERHVVPNLVPIQLNDR